MEPTKTVVYKKVGDRELRLSLFEPAGHKPTDRRACVLNIHGGGWTGGEARRTFPYADHYAKLGVVGVSLEYRLMKVINGRNNVTPFDCVKDGRSAVRYLKSHAAELGIDPDKIVVTGGSAGGHVAAGTALIDGVDEATDDLKVSPVPAALVLYYPVIDTSKEGYGNSKCGAKWEEISPLHRVKAGVPPTIVFHGTSDTVTPFKGAELFDKAMKAAGNACELIVYKDGKHGLFIYDRGMFEDALRKTDAFLKDAKILTP
jgi:acetyl esterase